MFHVRTKGNSSLVDYVYNAETALKIKELSYWVACRIWVKPEGKEMVILV